MKQYIVILDQPLNKGSVYNRRDVVEFHTSSNTLDEAIAISSGAIIPGRKGTIYIVEVEVLDKTYGQLLTTAYHGGFCDFSFEVIECHSRIYVE